MKYKIEKLADGIRISSNDLWIFIPNEQIEDFKNHLEIVASGETQVIEEVRKHAEEKEKRKERKTKRSVVLNSFLGFRERG